MIIYNLTDKTPPWEKTPRVPTKIKVARTVVEPGLKVEISDRICRPSDVASLIQRGLIALDVLPAWYVGEKMKGRASRRKRKSDD